MNIQVIILAGGRATRLRPLSLDRLKTLCPICNISLLGRLLRDLRRSGFRKAVISLPGMSRESESLLQRSIPSDFELAIPELRERFRGTVSHIRDLWDYASSSVMIIYGDSLLSVDYREIVDFHSAVRDRGSLATILYHRPADIRIPERDGRTYHGVMSVDTHGRVTKFVEKPRVEDIRPGFDLANAAVFVCEIELLERDPFKDAKDFSFDVFAPAVNKEIVPIYGCSIGGGFRLDIGSVERLYDANIKTLHKQLPVYVPGEEVQPCVWFGTGTHNMGADITPPVLLGEAVRVGHKAKLGPNVIVGDGCEIGDSAVVQNALLLENCHIGAGTILDRCVLGSHCRIADGIALPPYTVLGAYAVAGIDDWPKWSDEEV